MLSAVLAHAPAAAQPLGSASDSGEPGPSSAPALAPFLQVLNQRIFALGVPDLAAASGHLERQTSPRYAAYEMDELSTPLFGNAWVVPRSSVEPRTLRAIAALLGAGPDSVIGRRLAKHDPAVQVSAHVAEREEFSMLVLVVVGTRATRLLDLRELVAEAVWQVATTGPTRADVERVKALEDGGTGIDLEPNEVRQTVARRLSRYRSIVVELLPPKSPDPAALARAPVVESSARSSKARSAPAQRVAARARPDSPARSRASSRALPAAKRVHRVKKGDTLIGIARRYKTTLSALVQANRIDPARPIRTGQTLVVPR